MDTPSIFHTLYQLLLNLLTLAGQLLSLGLTWALLIVWTAWWLCGVDWRKMSAALRSGAWAPVVLLLVISALVWSRIAPSSCRCLGFPVANFWWQLGAVSLLAAYTLFLGWLQGVFGWTPVEINLEPADHGHDHSHGGHGHDHGPDHGHGSHAAHDHHHGH